MTQRSYITQTEAAQIIGVSVRTLQRWVASGVSVPTRTHLYGRWLYKRRAVERFAARVRRRGSPG